TFDRTNNYKRGMSDTEESGIVVNAQSPLNNGMKIYAWGGYTESESTNPYVVRRPLDNNNVRGIFPDGFQPIQVATVTDASFSTGLSGRSGAWDWEISETWGRNRVKINPTNTLNPSLGVDSPTSFYAGSVMLQQASTNLDFRRTVDLGDFPLNL